MTHDVIYRLAVLADLPAIVALLADDDFGRLRNPAFADAAPDYRSAFEAMIADPNNHVIVALRQEEIIGCYQLTFIRGLSFRGGLRAQIESVRVASSERGKGLGSALMRDAIARATQHRCVLVQLTTDTRRAQTRRFYERLGFSASHHGMKLKL